MVFRVAHMKSLVSKVIMFVNLSVFFQLFVFYVTSNRNSNLQKWSARPYPQKITLLKSSDDPLLEPLSFNWLFLPLFAFLPTCVKSGKKTIKYRQEIRKRKNNQQDQIINLLIEIVCLFIFRVISCSMTVSTHFQTSILLILKS